MTTDLKPSSLTRSALLLATGLALGLGGAALWLRRPAATASAVPAAPKVTQYTCPMHPEYITDKPGDCPLCGMALVPLEAGAPAETAAPVEGLATVAIDPQRQQLIGLRTAKAVRAAVGGEWRVPGRVTVDETRVRKVTVKVEGYVEKLHADFVGRPVKAGEPLLTVYSPELLSAQREYQLALRARASLGAAPELQERGRALVEAARRRLALWDVPEAVVQRLDQGGEPQRTVTLVAPFSGVVTAKTVGEGSRVAPGEPLLELTDLAALWVQADLQESDLRRVKVGQGARFSVQALPGVDLPARVVFLDPMLDPKTRTLRARLAVPNPGGQLRPEMFGEATFQEAGGRVLTIPLDAVLDAGRTKVVFVDLGQGHFEPREIQTGAQGADRVEVRSGLEEGEAVVVKAAFLVDSESRLKAALATFAKAKDPHAGHGR